jgi:hypothetical protein
MSIWGDLLDRLMSVSGGDQDIDQAVAAAFGRPAADFTESAETARGLIRDVLPDWHQHVGFDASGLFPYAALSRNDIHIDAAAPSLPLALLRVLVKTRGILPE